MSRAIVACHLFNLLVVGNVISDAVSSCQHAWAPAQAPLLIFTCAVSRELLIVKTHFFQKHLFLPRSERRIRRPCSFFVRLLSATFPLSNVETYVKFLMLHVTCSI